MVDRGRALGSVNLAGLGLIAAWTLGGIEARARQVPGPGRPRTGVDVAVPSPTAPGPTPSSAGLGAEPPPRGIFPDGLRPPIPLPGFGRPNQASGPPGLPPRSGRPNPGSFLDPGAGGPGVGMSSRESVLGGAFDPGTGWPFVLLDHFRPRPERVERIWLVQTRESPQIMGSEPWSGLRVLHFDAEGELQPRPFGELLAQTIGRPVLIVVQGSLTTADGALGGLLWTHSWLEENRALPPDVVVIAFDWPSQRVYRNDIRDIEEKARRAYVAGYHLARFLQAFPPESRVSLLGQSFGGRVVTSASHLLGGGSLNSQSHDPPVRLTCARPDLRLRAIALEAAFDHHWLDPGDRLDRVLVGTEGFLNLYNRRDEALGLYPFLKRSGHHRAIGRIGLQNSDLRELGPLAARYEEHDVNPLLGREHSLLDSVANAQIARWMAPYLWAADPGPSPVRPDLTDAAGGPRRRRF